MITRKFYCDRCHHVAEYVSTESPVHCGIAMKPGDLLFRDTAKATRLHFIRLLRTPEVDWQFGHLPQGPDGIREVWQCKIGRINGEKLGWICDRGLFWEWVAVPGVALRHGTAPTLGQSIQALRAALDGGIFAKRNIEQVAGAQ